MSSCRFQLYSTTVSSTSLQRSTRPSARLSRLSRPVMSLVSRASCFARHPQRSHYQQGSVETTRGSRRPRTLPRRGGRRRPCAYTMRPCVDPMRPCPCAPLPPCRPHLFIGLFLSHHMDFISHNQAILSHNQAMLSLTHLALSHTHPTPRYRSLASVKSPLGRLLDSPLHPFPPSLT